MLLKATFYVAKREIYHNALWLGERISEEEGNNRLAPSSTVVARVLIMNALY